MQVIHTIAELRQARKQLGRVAMVPTMGALHEGHLSLMRLAQEHADAVIVSIFVNPTQFGPNEDFDRYPRDLDGDLQKCRDVGVAIVFAPSASEMYPNGLQHGTFVEVPELTTHLCGASRPGHFRGVTTVVSKLFLAVQPDVAIFGQKDYQQAAVIARMTQDLLMPIEIIAAPTSREADGLAMSSRNRNLKPEHRAAALGLCRGLTLAHQSFANGERDAQILEGIVESTMQSAAQNQSFSIDYVDCVHPESLKPLNTVGDGGAVICVAAFVGEVRLIDNLRLDLELPAELTQWRNP